MPIDTVGASVWTFPEPSIFTILNSIQKIFADLKKKNNFGSVLGIGTDYEAGS